MVNMARAIRNEETVEGKGNNRAEMPHRHATCDPPDSGEVLRITSATHLLPVSVAATRRHGVPTIHHNPAHQMPEDPVSRAIPLRDKRWDLERIIPIPHGPNGPNSPYLAAATSVL
jgi:hypothetical protein